MRVLHITTNYPTADFPIFGIFVKEQIESLSRLGVENDVFYCNGEGKGIRKHITYVPKVWWKVIRGHYDLIHCHHVISAIILSLSTLALGKKCILSYQNDPDKEWGGMIFKILHIFFNGFIFKNRSGYLSYNKTYYLPNGCNEDFFRPMDKSKCRRVLGLDEGKIYILFMDSNKRAREQKRKDRFDDTLSILKDKYGYEAEPIILRNTPREMIPTIINACDLYLLSSDFEGSPNSVKECMCCNVPVVSTNVGNVYEMIGDISGNYVVNQFTPEALASAANTIFSSTETFDRRTPFLAKGYGINAVAKNLFGLYQTIIEKDRETKHK